LKTNIFLFGLVLFIISLIITLNMFFQQSYQSEMAEQFNRQQLLIARSIAKGIEGDMQHIDAETLSLARLLGEGKLSGRGIEEAVYTAYVELSEDTNVGIKIIDGTGKIIYSLQGEKLSPTDIGLLRNSSSIPPGKVVYLDRLAEDRRLVLFTPISAPKGGRNGLLVLELSINTITKKFLAPIKAGIRGYAWMMSGDGTLLYHPTQPKMVGKNLYKAHKSCFDCHKSFDVERKILESGDIGFSSYIAPYGEDKLIAFSKVKVADLSWIVCVSIPYSEVTFSIRKSMKLHSLLVISIFMATLAGAFAIVTMNRQRVKAEERTKYLEAQKLLEKEIIEAKDYLENLLESTESKIMVLDRDMIVHTVNSAHARLCGRKKEEIIGQNFFDVFAISEADRETGAIRKVLEECLGGRSHRLSNYGYPRGGKMLSLNINVNPLVLHGEVAGIILSSSDVTEEVSLKTRIQEYALRLEEMVVSRTDELQGEKEKLDAIVSAIEGGLCVLDNDEEKIIWANRTLMEWLAEESVEKLSVDKIYGGSGIHRAIVDDKMLREVVYHDYGRKKGYFQITSTPLIVSHAHRQTLILIQDITDIKKMEDRLMQSEKLSALARISAGIAHEIGNPLTSISSYVQILREMDHDEFTKESLDTVAKHINRIADIVRQMSSFSKMRTSDLRHHNARTLVDMTLDLVKYDKRMEGISISVDIPETMPPVRVDETQMIQVLMNIILNAADAMTNGGALEIQAREREEEVEISVADSGFGISPEHLEKIFDPFFTTKEKGTGLGLAVSYNIVKSYQGDILVENRPEGGTIFRVRLPYYES
jgi:PAS domain S-box-containing protein